MSCRNTVRRIDLAYNTTILRVWVLGQDTSRPYDAAWCTWYVVTTISVITYYGILIIAVHASASLTNIKYILL